MCSLKVEDLKTYRNQAVIDVIGKGQKFRRIPLKTETLLAIKDYLKATGNGTDPARPLFQTLGKHGPYEERDLTPKAIDCLIKAVAKKALIRKRIHPHVMRHTLGRRCVWGKRIVISAVSSNEMQYSWSQRKGCW